MPELPRKPTAAQKLRHSLLAQWHGLAAGPVLDRPAQSLGAVLGEVLKDLGLEDRMTLEEVLGAWRTAAGNNIANCTVPHSVTRGVLNVRFTQPTMHHALLQEKAALLRRLNDCLGKKKIKDIRFRHG